MIRCVEKLLVGSMKEIMTVEMMRESDAATIAAGTPGTELMYRAGKGIFSAVEEKRGWTGPVAIVCGSGNNAGDGYVLALLLKEKEIESKLLLVDEKFSKDGKYYFDRCLEAGISWETVNGDFDFSDYEIVLDCLYGTGFHGDVKGTALTLIEKINESGKYVVSVDINSGLNGNSGMGRVCVKSDLTVSVGSYQPGHFLNMAKDLMGDKVNCEIGIEPLDKSMVLWEAEDCSALFPKRMNMSNKGSYGYIALVGGSSKYTGAVRLAAMAEFAMRSGAGVTTVAVPKGISEIVAPLILESTVYPLTDEEGDILFDKEDFEGLIRNRKAIAFGMGIGISEEVERTLTYLLENYEGCLIVDADGITCLASLSKELVRGAKARIVLTPHLKEFSRLTGKTVAEIQDNPLEAAKEYAKDMKTIVLLKGPTTIVTDGERVAFVDRGCPGMATAGSGDVLSGIVAAVCGANVEKTFEAVATAAWINGRAGELAQEEYGDVSMIASDTARAIIKAIKEVRK